MDGFAGGDFKGNRSDPQRYAYLFLSCMALPMAGNIALTPAANADKRAAAAEVPALLQGQKGACGCHEFSAIPLPYFELSKTLRR